MISQRDSKVNKEMSRFSSEIALATKVDSAAMKTIALVTLTFLPAIFVTVCCYHLSPFNPLLHPLLISDVRTSGAPRHELLHRRLELIRRPFDILERPVDLFRHRSAAHDHRLVLLVVVAEERRKGSETS